MKAILEFNLPEDSSEFSRATKALDYYCCLVEFDRMLHSAIKYEDRSIIPGYQQGMERAASMLRDILSEHNIDIFE